MPTGKGGSEAGVIEVVTYAPTPFQLLFTSPAVVPANLVPTPDNLIAACRAKVYATLNEIKLIPESLDDTPILGSDMTGAAKLPFVVMIADAPSDAPGTWQVRAVPADIGIDFVYVAQRAQDGTTDDAQALRARLNVLQAAFYADYHLGGIVTLLRTRTVPAQKSNAYGQFFATHVEPVAVMVLSLAFTLVAPLPMPS